MQNDVKIIHSSFWANVFNKKMDHSDLIDLLSEMPPFAELKPQIMNEVVQTMHQRQFVAGEYVFYQNDPGIGLYIVSEGEIAVEVSNGHNKVLQLASFTKGDFFGELALLDGEKRSASARAITDSKLSVLFKPDLDDIIRKHPKDGITILLGFTKIINTRLRDLNQEYFQLYDENQKLKELTHGKDIA